MISSILIRDVFADNKRRQGIYTAEPSTSQVYMALRYHVTGRQAGRRHRRATEWVLRAFKSRLILQHRINKQLPLAECCLVHGCMCMSVCSYIKLAVAVSQHKADDATGFYMEMLCDRLREEE